MKAVGYKKSLPVDDADSLIDFETAKPEPRGRGDAGSKFDAFAMRTQVAF